MLVAACREFGVKDLTERVTLEREVEHPMNWYDGAAGTEYYRRLAGWWRLCNEADDCGHVVYTRVQLGVRALHKHLLTLVDKHEEHQLNKAADTAGLYGGRATRASLERYVVIALQLCRVSRELAKKKGAKPTEPAPKPPAANAAAAEPAKKARSPQDKCPVCQKTRAEHEGGRFCDKCVVCGKPFAEHPDGWCKRPNGGAPR